MVTLTASFVLRGKAVAVWYASTVGTFIFQMELYMKRILHTMTLAALAGLASFANSALAGNTAGVPDGFDQKAIAVHYGDLNPALPADATELLARVKRAVEDACFRNVDRKQIFLGPDRRACMTTSYANAVATINARRNVDLEALAALHEADANLNAAR